MIDFTNLKYLHIPEGEVVKISKGSELLWEKITKKYQKELAYLESTGTQWINTGYIPNNNTEIEMVVSGITANSFASASGTWFMGARAGYLSKAFGFYYNPQLQQFYYAYGNVMPTSKYDSSSLYNVQKTIKLDSSGLYVDGTKVISQSAQNFTAPVPLSLFGLNNNGTTISPTSFKFHFLKIWDGSTLVRDYIPVLDMNNAACLYDKVTEQLFYNSGTGVFNYATIEEEYREVGYIESTGTEWIDTEYAINTKTDSVYLEFEALDTTIYKWLFGEHDNNARFGIGTGDGTNKRNIAYGNNTYKVNDSQIYNGKHIFQADNTGVYLDGTKIANYSEFQSASSLYLFNLNLNTGTYQTKARVWKYQHYRNGELIRDMYPALSKSINRAGLFDRVSMRFFGNNGAGEFQYSGLPIEYEQVEFLQSNGNQYIDTGLLAPDNIRIDARFSFSTVSENGAIFGGRDGQTSQTCTLFLLGATKPKAFRFDRTGQTQVANSNQMSFDTESIYSFRYNGNQTIVVNERTGESITTSIGQPSTFTSKTIQLFAVGGTLGLKGRIYEWKFWKEGNLIQHLLPCYRKEDGVAGLYDTVTKAFFTNQGTGNFVYPTDIEVAQLMRANSLDEDMIEALAGVPSVVTYAYDEEEDNVVE